MKIKVAPKYSVWIVILGHLPADVMRLQHMLSWDMNEQLSWVGKRTNGEHPSRNRAGHRFERFKSVEDVWIFWKFDTFGILENGSLKSLKA